MYVYMWLMYSMNSVVSVMNSVTGCDLGRMPCLHQHLTFITSFAWRHIFTSEGKVLNKQLNSLKHEQLESSLKHSLSNYVTSWNHSLSMFPKQL